MINNMSQKKIQVRKGGFTLLVAIITTSLLLLVSFVVVNVALKQLALSYSNEESQYAFYNADSGTECALYWDLKNTGSTAPASAFATSTPGGASNTITCNNHSVLVGGSAGDPTSTFTIDFPKGCVIVQVTKADDGSTSIISKGYNTCVLGALRRFERGITLTY